MAVAFRKGTMECFFGSYELPKGNEVNKSAIVVFTIPELGIKFKAPFDGVDPEHSDYASLLALLEFIDGNQKYFSNHTYQIYGNNLRVVNQVNQKEMTPSKYSPLLQKALAYRQKYRFSIDWVASDSNPVYRHLFD